MASNPTLPTTGQVLRFLVKCFGQVLDKGVGRPHGSWESARVYGVFDSAQYKRIERLAKQHHQRRGVSREIEAALIDAVAALFNTTIKTEAVAQELRDKQFHERVQAALVPWPFEGSDLKVRLVFWIIYFIEHHEWMCPQLESAHPSNVVLWQWVEHATHLYTNAVISTVRANPSLLVALPKDLSWNMPVRQFDRTIKWPICHAVEWLESSLQVSIRDDLPSLLFPNPKRTHSFKYFRRLKRGDHLPSLETINRWAEYAWKYKRRISISRDRLRAVLFWCRALQYALRRIERRFGIDSVWLLVAWHNQAVASINIRLSVPPPSLVVVRK